ncbi:MAG: M24 family metallopeptidase C-terminal domain-containing protein [Muribaculaceae bacterium]
MTLFPYDITLMDMDQLTAQEKAQINAYHAEVRRRLNKYLNDEERAWLEAKTKEI